MSSTRHSSSSLPVIFALTTVVAAAAVMAFWPEHKDAAVVTKTLLQPIAVATVAALPIAPPPPAVLDASKFSDFLARLKTDLPAAGLLPATLDQAVNGLSPDPEVLELASVQPEYVKTAGDYLNLLVSDARIDNGRIKLAELAKILAAVETAYGVDRHIVLAIWGVESNYGAGMGSRSVVRSLATLAAYDARRPQFWRAELLAALRILQSGDTSAENMAGSWAGAMGHTQFMPTTYAVHAVDFDKDGRRDIWNSIPDALASTANYLKTSGWVAGSPWGFEVKLADGFDFALSAPGVTKTWAEWKKLGVARVEERAVPQSIGQLQLLLPAGAGGPAFLTGSNFKAILRYNNAISYALAVGHLGDRLSGGAAFAKAWPSEDKALGRAEREEMQRRLTSLGFDAGVADGVIGVGTRAAVRSFQKARGLPEDGHPDLALLARLRQEVTP
jgi:membrane-bound lytic murein transglycosylase B